MPVLSKPNTLKRVLAAVTFVSLVAAAAAANPEHDVDAVTKFLRSACPTATADTLVTNVITDDKSTVCCKRADAFDSLTSADNVCIINNNVPSLTTIGVLDCTITAASAEKTHCCAYIKAANSVDTVTAVASTCAEGQATHTVSPTSPNGAGQVLGVSGAIAAAAALSIVAAVL